MLSSVKRAVLPTGPRPLRILTGPYKGLCMMLDLQSQTQFYVGLYEVETNHVIRHASKHSDWFMDVGACQAETSMLFRVFGTRTIYAIEPSAVFVEMIKDNFAANNLPGPTIVHKFAGTTTGADMTALDDLTVDRTARGFIKIDVEGAEMDVLRGATSLLSNTRSINLLIETHTDQLESECLSFLRSLNYDTRIIRRAWWRKLIREGRLIPHNQWIVATSPGGIDPLN